MGDLISRSELLKDYNKLPIQRVDMVNCGDMYRNRPLVDLALVKEMIDAQPTAYDINKVVEKLEILADNSNDHMYESYFDGKEDGIREAIEIVKHGGVGKDTL